MSPSPIKKIDVFLNFNNQPQQVGQLAYRNRS
jgi:hypothetical protein